MQEQEQEVHDTVRHCHLLLSAWLLLLAPWLRLVQYKVYSRRSTWRLLPLLAPTSIPILSDKAWIQIVLSLQFLRSELSWAELQQRKLVMIYHHNIVMIYHHNIALD